MRAAPWPGVPDVSTKKNMPWVAHDSREILEIAGVGQGVNVVSIQQWTRFEPIKPAPPVISTIPTLPLLNLKPSDIYETSPERL
jgi:hypothetical protein